jgi:cytochrome c oxidase cbb3-type subunit 3
VSEFLSPTVAWLIAGVTVVSIIACFALLIASGKTKVMSGDNTTGHVWDVDLVEMNNPLPRWWVGLFIITLLFAIAYLFAYPGLAASKGSLGWSSGGQYEKEAAALQAKVEPIFAAFRSQPPEDLAKNAQAVAIGERIYLNNCAQCHGSDARGSKGFPNLTDADWLHGGSGEKIIETVTKGRNGVMPPLASAVGSGDDLRNLAQYVLSLSGSPHDSVKAALGKEKFAVCAACHGSKGEGNLAVGAPNLSDKIWLHGFGEQAIVKIVTEGKNNVMPAQSPKLSDDQIRVVAAYVLSRQGR